MKREAKKKPTNGRRKKKAVKKRKAKLPWSDAHPIPKAATARTWTEASLREEVVLGEVDLRIAQRLNEADAAAARRVTELGFELRKEMRTAIGAALASREGERPPTMAYRLARTLIDILEEAESGPD